MYVLSTSNKSNFDSRCQPFLARLGPVVHLADLRNMRGAAQYPGNSTGKKLSPKVKEIEPSGFQQNVRLEILKLAPQEQNLGQPRF